MVQVIENWAEITGIVRAVEPSDKGPAYRTILVDVDAVTDVSGFPNLVADTHGTALAIIVKGTPSTPEPATGTRISVRVRRASAFEVFASPEHLHPGPPAQ